MLVTMGVVSAIRIAFIVCASLAAAQVCASTAGAFQFVAGDVRLVLGGGSERPARKGTPLAAGDTIVTARNAVAQLKMADGAIVVVQPDSRLSVVEFRYAGVEDGSERVVYRLEHGGFRAITGAIGRRNKDTYQIQTPIAQMGVRGTDHETYYLPNGDGGSPAGAYNKVNVGAAYIRTRGGEVVVGPSQAGYAASANDAPRLLAQIPGFFNGVAQPRPAVVFPPRERVAIVAPVLQPVSTTSGLNLSDPGSSSIPASPGTAVAYLQGNGGLPRTGFDASIMPNGATVANTGGEAAFGVNWGTWQGGSLSIDGKPAPGGAHFISSNQLTTADQLKALPPTLVTATYSYAGGPAPTNQAGAAGSISALTVGVNFSKQTIDRYAVQASFGNTAWNASGSGTFAQFSGGSGIALKGTCSTCSAAATGSANGAFAGPGAERMITTFGLKAGQEGVSGAALLSR